MLRIDIISALPELLESPFQHSIIKRAQEKNLVTIKLHSIRDFGFGKNRQIDDTPYGGDAGMVLMCEPIFQCIEKLKAERNYDEIIYLCPDGEVYNQSKANTLSTYENLILLCGHYKGIDQRIRDVLITKEISVGDFVLTGGELGAAMMVDSIVRLIPGVISDAESALTDSFQDGLLAPPLYTKPAVFRGLEVPEILRSGHEKKIKEWQMEQALNHTKNRRPDLLEDL
jgi:tRNA (guanine37-N1)-methyltransferase